MSRCRLFLSLNSAEEIKCCIRNYNLETTPFQLNETTPQRFTSRQQYLLQRIRCWFSNSIQNPSTAGYAKITQNDDASTNLDDAVLDMPHRYELLVNQQASILHKDSKPAVALNQTTSLRLQQPGVAQRKLLLLVSTCKTVLATRHSLVDPFRCPPTTSSNHLKYNATAETSSQHSKTLTNTCRFLGLSRATCNIDQQQHD
ncbi:NAC transcription factor 29-like [Dorcoceras hygrometricum]|uniref:NAC transcription factor 29-like n=1 Tax=Dorcoceras hygrometricum TaxID=472368 RepID=A0A2Z7B8E4_9LAMI|nr:NAC transcription factor 29-like [Dorcoceras hygrometricum]